MQCWGPVACVLRAPCPWEGGTLRREAEPSPLKQRPPSPRTKSSTSLARPDPTAGAPRSPECLQTPSGCFDTHSLPTLRGPSRARLLPWQTLPLGANSPRNPICCVQNYGLFLAPASPRPRRAHRHPHRASGSGLHGVPRGWGLGAGPGRPASCFPLSGLEPSQHQGGKTIGIQKLP